jgi:hypothetical protein
MSGREQAGVFTAFHRKVLDQSILPVREAYCFDEGTASALRLRVRKIDDNYELAHMIAKPSGENQPQIIAAGLTYDEARLLSCLVFQEAYEQVAEVAGLIEDGSIPADVGGFSDLHDHMDANMLGHAGVFEGPGSELVGKGAPYSDEAWCGVINCAHAAVDTAIRKGTLNAVAAVMAP